VCDIIFPSPTRSLSTCHQTLEICNHRSTASITTARTKHIHVTMATQPQTSILLLGAGELGSAFLPHLTNLPSTHITLGIRTPSKYTHLTTTYPSLTLLPIDLSSPSQQLAETFSQYDMLISATGFGADPSTVLKLAHEVLAAGKIKEREGKGKVWFFPWQWGVDYDITGDGQGLMPLFGAQQSVRNLPTLSGRSCQRGSSCPSSSSRSGASWIGVKRRKRRK
jgi:hypothetical protein